MFGGNSPLSNIYSSNRITLDELKHHDVVCEYCGLKYNDLVSKYTHQIYYCMGRDLSLEASLLRIRNNVNMTTLPSYAYLNRFNTLSNYHSIYSLNDNINKSNSLNGFFSSNNNETKSEGDMVKLPKIESKRNSIKSTAVSSKASSRAPTAKKEAPKHQESTTKKETAPQTQTQTKNPTNRPNKAANKSESKPVEKPIIKSKSFTPTSVRSNHNQKRKSTSLSLSSSFIKMATEANSSASTTKSQLERQSNASNLKVHVIRLRPNQDLNAELDKYVKENDVRAGFIMTCVGSLTKATLRMAYSGEEQNEVKVFKEHMEIVSLVGTVSSIGGHHLHISLSDKDGHVIGGHVFGEMNIFTTAEVVIGECLDMHFTREFDHQSGFDELVVNQHKKN